jgi:hypothetical protein
MLEQRFRFDLPGQHAGNGANTTALDAGRGPAERSPERRRFVQSGAGSVLATPLVGGWRVCV